jgi:cytochrome c oxidase cbb3-type subunit 3
MEPNNHNLTEKDELTGDKILSGHEYDGIQELDNKLPKWWIWLFYITIIFAVVYFTSLHILQTGDTQDEAYKKEVEAATIRYQAVTPANTIDAMAAGKATFEKNCVVCHLAQAQGLVGPNLTDDYWIHGCAIGDIFKTISTGVPEKGMISWKDQLTPEQIQQVASYVVSLRGSNPPNPKAPQGVLCK